ncbi:amino acid permease, partial [Staphylococcus aureus]|nr:amino acid permease [Staphylococcus aureus]
IFYIGSLAVIMSIYPWNAIDPTESPFVRVFLAAGIVAAAGVVNFVVLTSAASACNSAIFSTSRMVYGLAKDNNAPVPLT